MRMHDKQLTDDDLIAAHQAIERNWPDLTESDSKYESLLIGLATFNSIFGRDKFELRYNLRIPRDNVEEWTKQCFQGQISREELSALLKQDAEREIDIAMLNAFHSAYEQQMYHYGSVLQNAVIIPSQKTPYGLRQQELEIDKHVAALSGKLPLWKEHLETVMNYLEELRITSGAGLIRIGEFEATSAHWLAQLVICRIQAGWESCKNIAQRTWTDPRYHSVTTAVELFYEQWFSKFPSPQGLSEHLREEFVLARVALKRQIEGARTVRQPSSNLAGVDTNQLVDNESRELVLIGEVMRIVGAAGHIFRPTQNSDWGIDAEIEFKDSECRATGQRIYLQLITGSIKG